MHCGKQFLKSLTFIRIFIQNQIFFSKEKLNLIKLLKNQKNLKEFVK